MGEKSREFENFSPRHGFKSFHSCSEQKEGVCGKRRSETNRIEYVEQRIAERLSQQFVAKTGRVITESQKGGRIC